MAEAILSWELAISVISIIISGLTLIFSLFFIYHKEIRGIDGRIGELSNRITGLETKIEPLLVFEKKLWEELTKRIIDKSFSSNPASKKGQKERALQLLEKPLFQLDLKEAKELKGILETELEEARKIDSPTVPDLTILLALLEGRIGQLEK